MSNIFQEAKWQFRFDPAGSLFFASLFVLFLVLSRRFVSGALCRGQQTRRR